MKTLQRKSRNAILLISILTLLLPGCGTGDSESNAVAVFVCVVTVGLICPSSSGRTDANASTGNPPAVQNLSASVAASTPAAGIGLRWQAANEAAPVLGYRVYRDGEPIGDTGNTEFTDGLVDADTRYCYEVSAYDESRSESPRSEPACATTSWVVTIVDAGILAPRAALALDSLGQVHFVYHGYDRQGARSIRYANRLTGRWVGEDTGFAAGVLAEDLALVVDATGTAHIGSLDQYISGRFGAWHRQALQDHNFAALSLDSRGYVHAVSGDGEAGFSHVTNTAGGWYYEPLGEGEWRRLAALVDDFDVMHVVFYNFAARELRYLNNRAGTWIGEVVASDLGPVWRLGLAVDARGTAHLVYQRRIDATDDPDAVGADARAGLEYASNAGGRWHRQLLDPGIETGAGAAIAIDAGGFPHVSYRGPGGGEIRYLTNVSGAWQTTVIDGGETMAAECGLAADLCGATDIAVDITGRVHIGYTTADSVLHASR